MAKRAYLAVGGTGYGRVDIRIDDTTEEMFVLEVNPCPAITFKSLTIGVDEPNTSRVGTILHLAKVPYISGLIAVCRGDTQAAILAFESAASLEPDNAAHWLALGRVQMQREDAWAALQAFEKILLIQPDDLVALIDSYDALLALGNVREAQGRLDRMVELAPHDFRVLKRQRESLPDDIGIGGRIKAALKSKNSENDVRNRL